MRITVKYMAAAREIAGSKEETVEMDDSCTVMSLLKTLSEKHGQRMREFLFDLATNRPRPNLHFLLDGRSIHMINGFETTLKRGSTFLIVPPVAGG